MFNFGQSFGILKGICSAMHLPVYYVRPAKWKKYFNLLIQKKMRADQELLKFSIFFITIVKKKR